MVHYQSPKWRLFASRPTSILKRDFLKWTYLSLERVVGYKLTKLLAIGNSREMDIFVDKKEDDRNYQRVVKDYQDRKIEIIFAEFKKLIKTYQPRGEDLLEQSLNAMKDIGPIVIFSYYVERLANLAASRREDQLLKVNGELRDQAAKIFYPLYDRAHDWLVEKYKEKPIDHYTIKELSQVLISNIVGQRKKNYVFSGTKQRTKVYTGLAAEKFLRLNYFQEIKIDQAKKLKGLSAYLGKVKGRVKIVRGLEDLKGCAGRIVVCRETIIEYAPFLKKVLALVTDLGGINCHAAIIAREFKIPCIVGIGSATDVLKDGGWAEVDAVEGIVKIITDK